jgi:micrococcal nuclease
MSRRRPSFKARRRSYPAWVVLILAALVLLRWWQTRHEAPPPDALAEGTYAVERVVDGDTLLLANRARVRLIGADTPETVKPDSPVEPFGPQATEFTNRFIDDAGGQVRLEFDRERLDRYGRFLAYVYDGPRMLNEELIRAGLATAETGFRYSAAMKTRFRRAEDEAKAAGRGIWSREPLPAGSL